MAELLTSQLEARPARRKMKIDKAPSQMSMILSASFSDDGILRIENRAQPPVNYGTALAIKLTKEEARQLGEALRAFADV